MGNAASVQPEQFEKLKAEFESKKDSLSDEELFNHMKSFYENLIGQSQAQGAVATSGGGGASTANATA
eukprot:CAMPEP_0174821348 /NCGR_PEP_ID=MMETSP1107-20130205/6918_1 /TAXON_ID=36770 /ORGANISM="Paraphysomonas vestita, Strain GFlagA" /LENGTH=67 /DNA_ID=CAMNT_0016038265 /DNA_START=85 /DNA_END=288 /DNA_ORIENTATION=+